MLLKKVDKREKEENKNKIQRKQVYKSIDWTFTPDKQTGLRF